MSMKETAAKTAILKDNGIIIVTPNAELMDSLRAIGGDMLSGWKNDAGAEGVALLKAYKN